MYRATPSLLHPTHPRACKTDVSDYIGEDGDPCTDLGCETSAPQTANWKATPAWKVIKAVSDMTPVPGGCQQLKSKLSSLMYLHDCLAIDDDAQKKTSKTGTFQISADVLTQLKAT
jgi:hypothetical protein